MKLADIKRIINGVSYTSCSLDEIEVVSACGADLLSDVLAFTRAKTLLLTGLIHPQVIRTAEMLDLAGVVFVRGKEPSREMIEMAQSKGIPLLSTNYPMFECCGLLFEAGLGRKEL
ncbi:MAG: hypothetical protein QHH10_02850 [Peptococcaceae bacterium]|nr:hypothetical protein [Peptococcaceae bacterium]MDH7524233.1 hypothetical protein [Peptococcaceae bacterium]